MAKAKSIFEGMEDATAWLSEKLKLSAAAPNALSYIPHPKQQKFHYASSIGRLYIGGNRSGKSVGGIVEDIWWATGRHPYRVTPDEPIRGRIVCVDFLNGIQKIIIPMLQQWIPLSDLKGGSWDSAYEKENRTLRFANGSFIELMSYDQDLDKFAGTSRHFVHFDEEPPQDIFTECMARLVDTNGSWWITMTPVEGMTWVFEDIYEPAVGGLKPGIAVIEVDMTENPYLSKEAIDTFTAGLSADDAEARVRGKFIQLGGRVYKDFSIERHVVPFFIPPTSWDWYCSVDHGYNNPTAWLWHAVSPDGDVVTFAEHYKSEMTVEEHAATVHARNAMFGRVPDVIIGDPAMAQRSGITGTSIQTEYMLAGLPIQPGNNDVVVGVAKVAAYLKLNAAGRPRWVITENCTNLISEMLKLRWETWATKKATSKNSKRETIHKKDDHAADSARYFFTFLPDLTPVGSSAGPMGIIRPTAESMAPVAGRYDDLLVRAHNNRIDTKWESVTETDWM